LDLSWNAVGAHDAPPVLMIHGITASGRYWLPRMLPLAQRRRLVVPDLPGFGLSPKPYVDYNMDFFTEALFGFIQRCGLEDRRIPIVGHSLGALLALEIAAREPERVERLALLNVPRFESAEVAHRVMLEGSSSYRSLLLMNSWSARVSQMRRVGWRLTTRSLRRLPWEVLVDARRFTFRSLTSTLENCLLHYRVDDTLSRCPEGLPTLLIHGEQDQPAPLTGVTALTRRPPYPRLETIPDGGHHLVHTHTSECLRLLDEFLAGNLDGPESPAPRGLDFGGEIASVERET
jgi:pimeloyl-ACP methyl ester carboxylesterase